jgi:hypothetical protein
MALLWMDGFDHYGTGATGAANMLLGAYAELGSINGTPTTTQARTGSAAYEGYGGYVYARRIFGAAKQTTGVGCAWRCTQLPAAEGPSLGVLTWLDTNGATQITLAVNPTGKVTVYRGNIDLSPTTLGSSADGVIVANTWQHIEAKVKIADADGAVEVRVNGVTVLNLTNVDTKASTLAEASMICFGARGNPGLVRTWHDDVYAWDTTGASNNDFIGDVKVRTLYPDANEALQEWAVNTGNAWDAINDAAQDGDTTYIYADPSGLSPPYTTSEFTLQDLPSGVGAVRGVQVCTLAKKTDAGTANLQASVLSSSSASAGTDWALSTAYTYYNDIHETDPATGSAWTKSGVDGARLRIRRTAE